MTPIISTISPLFQCLCNCFLISALTVFGTCDAAKAKSSAAFSASEKALCVLYSQMLSNCSCLAPYRSAALMACAWQYRQPVALLLTQAIIRFNAEVTLPSLAITALFRLMKALESLGCAAWSIRNWGKTQVFR